jgi:hypothetical protein
MDHETAISHVIDVKHGEGSPEEDILSAMRAQGGDLTTRDVEKLAALKAMQGMKHNKMTYRLNANRKVNGGKRLLVKKDSIGTDPEKIIIGFSSKSYSVLEGAGYVTIFVDRRGSFTEPIAINYHC